MRGNFYLSIPGSLVAMLRKRYSFSSFICKENRKGYLMETLDFKKIDEARKILGLNEEVSMEEIKSAFRQLSLKYHPDRCSHPDKKYCEEMFKKINYAKDIIGSYCANYRFSFQEKDVRKNIMTKEQYDHLKRFYDGWFGDLGL